MQDKSFLDAFVCINNLNHSESDCHHQSHDPISCNKESEDDTKYTIPFVIVSKRIIRNTFNKSNVRLIP